MCGKRPKNEKVDESGPYGSVWADTLPESIPRGLGKEGSGIPPGPQNPLKSKIRDFGVSGLRGKIRPIFPYSPVWECPITDRKSFISRSRGYHAKSTFGPLGVILKGLPQW